MLSGQDVLAVADGTIVSIHDGIPDQIPFQMMVPKAKEDYGGNHVILEIAPNVFAEYEHLQLDSLTVKVGDTVKAGAPLGKIGNTGPSEGPHLHSASPTNRILSLDGAYHSSSTVSPR
jgi:murein DD-endopeptidase MepM/ murein hydrolase activator NlpD